MNISRTSRITSLIVVAAAVMAACGPSDSRSDAIQPGSSRDSALALLTDGRPVDSTRMPAPGALVPSSDTLKNVWRRAEYLVNGHKIEVLYYSPNDEKWKATDTVPEGKVIPVVLIDGTVYGTGRRALKDAVANFNIPAVEY